MKQRKPLPPAALIALIVAGALVFGLVGYMALIRPQGAKVKKLKAETAGLQQQITDRRTKAAAIRSAPRIEVADVYRLAKAMPDSADMPDLLLELGQLARDSGIRFDSISPGPVAAIGSYSVMPVSVTFNGTFYNLADFLYRLRSLVAVHGGRLDATGRLFSVDTLTFNESPLKFPRLQATVVIDAFVYGAAAAPAGAVPPTGATTTTGTATTSTSTTSTTTTSSSTTTPSTSASAAGAP